VANAGVEKAKAAAIKLAASNFVKGSKNEFINLGGNVAKTLAQSRAHWILEGVSKIRNQYTSDRPGLFAGLNNFVKGPVQEYAQLLREVSKKNERERKHV